MSLGIGGIYFQNLFLVIDNLVKLPGVKIFGSQIIKRVEVERVQLNSALAVQERLLMISEINKVEAIQNISAAQVWIQLQGAFKFSSSSRPFPVRIVRDRKQRMSLSLCVVNGQCTPSIRFHFWIGFAVGNVSVVRDYRVIFRQPDVG